MNCHPAHLVGKRSNIEYRGLPSCSPIVEQDDLVGDVASSSKYSLKGERPIKGIAKHRGIDCQVLDIWHIVFQVLTIFVQGHFVLVDCVL